MMMEWFFGRIQSRRHPFVSFASNSQKIVRQTKWPNWNSTAGVSVCLVIFFLFLPVFLLFGEVPFLLSVCLVCVSGDFVANPHSRDVIHSSVQKIGNKPTKERRRRFSLILRRREEISVIFVVRDTPALHWLKDVDANQGINHTQKTNLS